MKKFSNLKGNFKFIGHIYLVILLVIAKPMLRYRLARDREWCKSLRRLNIYPKHGIKYL